VFILLLPLLVVHSEAAEILKLITWEIAHARAVPHPRYGWANAQQKSVDHFTVAAICRFPIIFRRSM
jgi:hypothetical protein